MRDVVRFYSTFLTTALGLVDAIWLFFYSHSCRSGLSGESLSGTRPRRHVGSRSQPLSLLAYDKLAAKKDNQQTAGKTKKRIDCKQQAEKLLSDSDRQAYMKECMSDER